ncbi:MAG: hypothetical protein HYZ50_00665 [Deltaproteobacteria bacterium]|nr:hypothetical protein [Deltaproteobacteria bacterium]
MRRRKRERSLLTTTETSASTAPPSTAPIDSIVTELLTDSKVGELMQDAIILEPQSQLFRQISTAAGPALQLAMDGTAVAAQRGRFLVEFSSEGTSALKSGGVVLLRRVDGRLQPTLMNAVSRIEENATIVSRVGQEAARAVALGRVVILFAVQAQLVSMERQLGRIEKKVDAVKRFQDEEPVSRVRGWLRKLEAVSDEMSIAPWADGDRQRWLASLDAADVKLFQVEDLAKQQCNGASDKIKETKLTVKWLGPSGDSLLKELMNEVERYRQYHDLHCLVIVGRLVVAHLKKALGKPTRAQQIRDDVDALATSAAAHQEVLQLRASEFRTLFRFKGYETMKQRILVEDASAFGTRNESILARLYHDLGMLDLETKRTVRVIVEVRDDGKVQPLALLPEDSGQVLTSKR